jgi:hypothetical protein
MRTEEPSGPQECPILLKGVVDYSDTVRPFSVCLGNAQFFMRRKGPPVNVSRELTTSFILRLAADHWFDSMDLGGCIAQGFIPLRADGALVIDQAAGAGPCMGVGAAIRENIAGSGRLEVLSW